MTEIKVILTAWCLCSICTHYTHGITFSGHHATPGITAACGAKLYGKVIYIEGIGTRWCEDTGGKVRGDHVDVLVEDHEFAKSFSRRTVTAFILGEWWNGKGRAPKDTPRTLDRPVRDGSNRQPERSGEVSFQGSPNRDNQEGER